MKKEDGSSTDAADADLARRMRLVVESVRDYAIFMLDADGRVMTWNPGAELAKGYSSAEIMGQHMEVFYLPVDRRRGLPRQLLGAAVRDGRVEDEGWRLRKDGTSFWADVVITALREPTGELVGFAKVTRDLTERRRADEERVRLARAEEAVRLHDEFLSIASHEIRTPLAAVKLDLDRLNERRPTMDGRTARAVERAVHGANRLTELVETLFDLSRISTGHLTLARRELDLGDMLRHRLGLLKEEAVRAGCEVTLHARPAVRGYWDQVRLEQVITSLFANAIKYGAGAPVSISLELAADGREAVLEIGDRGAGIAPENLGRIFDRFERGVSSFHFGGLGLGLYVARTLVEAHGGSIAASNRAEGGACFTVRLPLWHGSEAPSTGRSDAIP